MAKDLRKPNIELLCEKDDETRRVTISSMNERPRSFKICIKFHYNKLGHHQHHT